MTALIAVNAIAAAVVIAGLAAAARLGYLTAGGRFDPALRRFELLRGSYAAPTAVSGEHVAEWRKGDSAKLGTPAYLETIGA